MKQFITDVGTSSYAAAPIVPEGRVVGFLHADHYPSPRPVDEVDSYVLGELADGFGRIYERVTLLERLRGQRDHVRETLRAVEEIMENVARAELELARGADERSIVGAAAALALAGEPSNLDELLTPPRAGGDHSDRRRTIEQRDRRAARDLRGNRQIARQADPAQARRRQPLRGDRPLPGDARRELAPLEGRGGLFHPERALLGAR